MLRLPTLTSTHCLYIFLCFVVLAQAHEQSSATESVKSAGSVLSSVAGGAFWFLCCGGCCCCRRRPAGPELEDGVEAEEERERDGFPFTLPSQPVTGNEVVKGGKGLREPGDGIEEVRREEIEAPPPAYKSVWTS